MITIHSIAQAFTSAECDMLAQMAHDAPAQDAKLVKQSADHNIRRSELVWLDDVAGAEWVMDRIIDVVRDANRAVYNFDLTEFAESAQIARYGSERQGHQHCCIFAYERCRSHTCGIFARNHRVATSGIVRLVKPRQ